MAVFTQVTAEQAQVLMDRLQLGTVTELRGITAEPRNLDELFAALDKLRAQGATNNPTPPPAPAA